MKITVNPEELERYAHIFGDLNAQLDSVISRLHELEIALENAMIEEQYIKHYKYKLHDGDISIRELMEMNHEMQEILYHMAAMITPFAPPSSFRFL